MSFSAEWLALREPADIDARSVEVTTHVLAALPAGRVPLIVDLGCGTGSNARYLSSHVHRAVSWRLLDYDPLLLAEARRLLGGDIETQVADLRSLSTRLLAGADLVTASALLDLVSDAWLDTFVEACRSVGASVLVALNYDGRTTCEPADGDDEFVVAHFNRHQRTDKGFGPALGPDSGARAAARLVRAGYVVNSVKSDWVIGPDRSDLQRELLRGIAGAARELATTETARVDAWLERRLQWLDAGTSTLIVGHDDVGGVIAR